MSTMITILLCTRKSVVCIKGLFINSWTIYLLKLHVLTIHYLKITSSLIDDDGYDSYFIDHPAPLNCYGFYIYFFYFQVEMPVFFYLDPDLLNDPRMDNVDDIVLSYTFFSSKDQEVKYPGQQTNMPANA